MKTLTIALTGVLFVAVAAPCFADVVSVNTTTCISGGSSVPCAPPSTLTDLQNSGSVFDYEFTLSNDDQFLVSGNTAWSNLGGGGFSFGVDASVEYLGNAINGSVPSQADTVAIDDSQFLDLDGSTSGTFSEGVTLFFYGSLGTGSYATALYTVDGQPLPTMTLTPGSNSQSFSNVSISGFTEPVLIDWTQTQFFGAGSLPGSMITPNFVPEPSYYALMLLAGVGLAFRQEFRKRRS